MSITEHWIETPRGRLFLRDWAGDGSVPLILMHDSLGSVDLWRGFPEALARATGRRVLAYDRLGFGRSGQHPGELDRPGFVTGEARGNFARVIAALGIDRFAILGHSVGGGMGIGIAAAYPDRCRALVTISAQTFAEPLTLQGIREAKAGFAASGQMERLARWHGEKAPWVLDAWTETWLSPAFADWTLDAALARVRCPVLAIHGEADEYGSIAHPRRLAERSGGPVVLRLMAGEGHFPHRSDEAGTVAAVAEFLAGLPAGIGTRTGATC
ncbi:alpha/beta fold hydrolase [Paracoccus zhejiangensis]|uniref:Alpha/beta hydrolase n=1 Tax=Paracoccus zhejiangensis TaxID=1077935 RepID=A0A2H5EUG4_9RHOB|nr:alpha/beta hydrolase [Paracoccus zhejiangensis]AUH62937.1 alpha/beta hydrolase [Paracoccus zhejiangensis]